MKEIKENRDGEVYHTFGLEKEIYRFNTIPIKLPVVFFISRTTFFAICVERQNVPDTQRILRKKNGTGGINLPDFRLSHSPQETTVLAQRQKYRSMEQNRKPRDKSTHL